jgi:DNA-binding transcriptional LysR family regulator
MHSAERLKGIDVFVCTADAGSFTAAGERLHLTNSAVGKAVGRLEQRLGIRLFDRTTRTMALTDAGAAFYDTCVRVLAELGDAEAVLAAQRLRPAACASTAARRSGASRCCRWSSRSRSGIRTSGRTCR